jgi:hypothetical protein
MADKPDLKVGFGTPFAEQIDFLRAKLNLPTDRWDDIERSAHDRAFIVAGAAKADLLADLRGDVDQAVRGGSLGQFRKEFNAIVAKHGWTGWTGEGSPAGVAWRTKVIYQTNLLTSYAAGRYRQLTDPAMLASHPFWQYVHSDSVLHPRPLHLSWNGLTLPADHPFWSTNTPPNGWGCRCHIRARARPLPDAPTEPPAGWAEIDPKTGEPAGVDKGFGYAPGANRETPLRQMVQDKLITYPDAIAKALSADLNRRVLAENPAAFAARVLAQRNATEPLWLGFVENWQAVNELVGRDVKGYVVMLTVDAPRHVDRHHGQDGGDQRPPRPQDYDKLLEMVNQPDAMKPGHVSDKGNPTLVVEKRFGSELFRAVFEVLSGKKNRSLSLTTLLVKVGR